MSISIHHGSPGSYKTSGAIQTNVIPEIFSGRLIVTNVRGFDNPEKVKNILENNSGFFGYFKKKVPDTFDLVFIDTTTEEGKHDLATWFHWLPLGAYLFIDEVNTIYPTEMRPAELKSLFSKSNSVGLFNIVNSKGEILDETDEVTDSRPETVQQAFEMHRHYNWDICCTTPHIKKVHGIIRNCSEGALRHKNQAMIGLKGFYQEILHMADDDGKSKANHIQMVQRRVKKYVFDLYSSTTTNKISDTKSGTNIFLSLPVLLFSCMFIFGIYFVLSSEVPTAFKSQDTENTNEGIKEATINSSNNGRSVRPVKISNTQRTSSLTIDQSLDTQNINKLKTEIEYVDYLSDFNIFYVGNIKFNDKNNYQLQLVNGNKSLTISTDWLSELGYELVTIGECLAQLSIGKITRLITCPLSSNSNNESTSLIENLSPI